MDFFKAMCFDTTSHMIYFDYKAYAFYQNKNYSCFTYDRNENKTILVFDVSERTMKV